MQISKNIITYNTKQKTLGQPQRKQQVARPQSFCGLTMINKNRPKAILLALFTLISGGNAINTKMLESRLSKTFNNIELSDNFKNVRKFIENNINAKSGLFAQESNLSADICNYSAEELPTAVEKFVKSKSGEFSFYRYSSDESTKEVDARKLKEYKRIINSVPKEVTAKGPIETLRYQNSVMSIIEKCDEFGAMYVKNVPDPQNMFTHAQGINRLLKATAKIQGCEFKNCSLVNGLSANDLFKKVVIPSEKIANGEKIGRNQNTLVFISSDDSLGLLNGFEWNLAKNSFNTKTDSVDDLQFNFSKSFYDNYDNIILMQPKGKSADETLDKFFSKFKNGLDTGANLDIAFIGHGTNRIGTTLSERLGLPLEKSLMDESDFYPIEKGGNQYAQDIKELFQNSIDKGYKPRVIGIGCSSEYMQNSMNTLMDPKYVNNVRVFGTPFTTNGNYVLGFNNDALEMMFDVSTIKNNYGLVVELTELNYDLENCRNAESFKIDPKTGANMDILKDYFDKGITNGGLKKPSGVTMQYLIKDYNSK